MNKCEVCGNNSEGEYCFKHKPRTSLGKGKALRAKPLSPETKQEREAGRDKMWKMFLEIWNERPHISEVSGKPLGKEPLTVYFDHLLEKSIYPEFKYEKRNIALVTFEEHQAKTNGFPLEKHQQLIDRAKEILLSASGEINEE